MLVLLHMVKNQPFQKKYHHTDRYGGGSMMICGCLAALGLEQLSIFNGACFLPVDSEGKCPTITFVNLNSGVLQPFRVRANPNPMD